MNPTDTLDTVHACLCTPFDWTPETLDRIAAALTAAGYGFPDSAEAGELEAAHGPHVPHAALAPWRPARRDG
jgi:hypothetical protein